MRYKLVQKVASDVIDELERAAGQSAKAWPPPPGGAPQPAASSDDFVGTGRHRRAAAQDKSDGKGQGRDAPSRHKTDLDDLMEDDLGGWNCDPEAARELDDAVHLNDFAVGRTTVVWRSRGGMGPGPRLGARALAATRGEGMGVTSASINSPGWISIEAR